MIEYVNRTITLGRGETGGFSLELYNSDGTPFRLPTGLTYPHVCFAASDVLSPLNLTASLIIEKYMSVADYRNYGSVVDDAVVGGFDPDILIVPSTASVTLPGYVYKVTSDNKYYWLDNDINNVQPTVREYHFVVPITFLTGDTANLSSSVYKYVVTLLDSSSNITSTNSIYDFTAFFAGLRVKQDLFGVQPMRVSQVGIVQEASAMPQLYNITPLSVAAASSVRTNEVAVYDTASQFLMPIASLTNLGGVIVGTGLQVAADGTLSIIGDITQLPVKVTNIENRIGMRRPQTAPGDDIVDSLNLLATQDSNEEHARMTGDSQLQINLDAETRSRQSADTALGTRIDNVSTEVTATHQAASDAAASASSAATSANTAETSAAAAAISANEAKAIAEGRSRSRGYDTLALAIAAINSAANTDYSIGDSFYIRETGVDVPDIWVSNTYAENVQYTFTTSEAFNNALVADGFVQVGFYKIAKLETGTLSSQHINAYIVGTTPYAAGWLSEIAAGVALTPNIDMTYVIKTYGDYYNRQFVWNGTEYEELEAAGSIKQQVDFEGTLSGGVLTFTSAVAYDFRNKAEYEFDLLFSAVDVVSDVVTMVLNNNGNIIHITNVRHPNIATEVTFGDMRGVMQYDETTGFRWIFDATYNEVTTNGVTSRSANMVATVTKLPEDVIQVVTNAVMLDAITDAKWVGNSVVTPSDDDGYSIGKLYKWNATTVAWDLIGGVSGAVGSKITGSLPTVAGNWGTSPKIILDRLCSYQYSSVHTYTDALPPDNYTSHVNVSDWTGSVIDGSTFGVNQDDVTTGTNSRGDYVKIRKRDFGNTYAYIDIYNDGTIVTWHYSDSLVNSRTVISITWQSNRTYTISNSAIKLNSYINMSLSSSAEVRPYSKADGNVVVEMDAVPATPIPYIMQVIETSNESALFVDNKYVPTVHPDPVVDTVVLSSASWFSIASTYSPYTYGYTALISKLTPVSVELVNDQPVVFAKYGFAITSINTTDNTDYNIAFVISLSQPDVDVTLKFITEVN